MLNISNNFFKFLCFFIILIINIPIMAKNNIYKYSFNNIDGKKINLSEFEGKPIFLVKNPKIEQKNMILIDNLSRLT